MEVRSQGSLHVRYRYRVYYKSIRAGEIQHLDDTDHGRESGDPIEDGFTSGYFASEV